MVAKLRFANTLFKKNKALILFHFLFKALFCTILTKKTSVKEFNLMFLICTYNNQSTNS